MNPTPSQFETCLEVMVSQNYIWKSMNAAFCFPSVCVNIRLLRNIGIYWMLLGQRCKMKFVKHINNCNKCITYTLVICSINFKNPNPEGEYDWQISYYFKNILQTLCLILFYQNVHVSFLSVVVWISKVFRAKHKVSFSFY